MSGRLVGDGSEFVLTDRPRVTVPELIAPDGYRAEGEGLGTRFLVRDVDGKVEAQVMRFVKGEWVKHGDPVTMDADDLDEWTIDQI